MAIITSEIDESVFKEFMVAYGSAIMTWAYVEHRFIRWHIAASGLPEADARIQYFSAPGFKRRSEMLITAVEKSPAFQEKRTWYDFIHSSVKVARYYIDFRNRLVHGMPMSMSSEKGVEFAVFDGKHKIVEAFIQSVSYDALQAASANFDILQKLIFRAYSLRLDDERVRECTARLFFLSVNPEDYPRDVE